MNDGRQLLAISWEMPPLSGPRAVQVSRTLNHLVTSGWESSVICFRPRSTRYFPDADLARRLAPADGVRLVPVHSPEERLFFRALWRLVPPLKRLPDEKWVWIRPATHAALTVASTTRFDAIATFGQPWSDHLIGRRLRRSLRLPWVAHFSDPWADSPYFSRVQHRVWQPMERAVVREADALVFVTRQTAEQTMAKYPKEWRRKVAVIPHGFDRCMLPPRPAAPSQSKALHLVYTGRFYGNWRTPEHLLRALASIASTAPDSVRVTFAGPIEEQWRHVAAEIGVGSGVEFRGRVSWAESMTIAMSADVLITIDAPSDVNVFLPSKLIEYLPLEKPILGLTPAAGASADLLQQLDYPIAPPNDAAAIERALRALIQRKQTGALAVSPHHATVARSYDIRHTTAQFAAVLSASVASN